MKNILLIDDHVMVLEGMRNILSRIDNVVVTGATTSANQALHILNNLDIHIVFLDISMPAISGIALCKIIKTKHPQVKVIALSSFAKRSYMLQMITNGANGYIIKSATKEEIEAAIEAVVENKLYVSYALGKVEKAMDSEVANPLLTMHEKEVLHFISKGMTRKEIAEKISVNQNRVDSHLKNLFAKFNVQNTAALISIAAKMGVND